MNKVILVGNVSLKKELKKTGKGTSVININLATNEKYRDSEGEAQQHTDYHSLTIYGKLAEIADKHVEVGATIAVGGHLSYGSYEKDDQTHYTTSVVVEDLEFHSAKKSGRKDNSDDCQSADGAKEKEKGKEKPKAGSPCPQCGTGKLKKKSGANGGFLGCDNFPLCKYVAA